MAVDRGGLQYTIKVRDEFSKVTSRFKSEMRASKAAFGEFQKGVSAQQASAKSFKDTSKEIDAQTAFLKKLQAESQRQSKLEREAVKIRNTQQRDATREANSRLAAERTASRERAKLLLEEQKALKASIDARNRNAKEALRLEQARKKDEAQNLTDQQKQLKAFVDAQNKREREAARISKAMTSDEQKRLKEVADAQKAHDRDIAKQAKAAQKDTEQKNAVDPQFQAQERLNKSLFEEQIQRKQINLLRAKAQSQFAQGDFIGGTKTLRQVKSLEDGLKDVDKAGNSLFFTFRRLVGILAVFTIARNVVQGFQDLIKAGIEFDDKIQSATTAIGGLLVAVTDVRDEFGQTVTPAEELPLAMKAAQDQVKKLRQDALRTTATFQQLLDVFQIAVAPGFAAGLNLDEIRKITLQVSQAASAIGLSQDQLAEEIRSLLSGTIQARTTRIATALGITNADIRRLKEAGKLFDFLQQKFAGFGLAAEKQARSTITGLTSLITDAVQNLLGEAAKPLFDTLISLGNEFFDQILTIKDAEGNLQPNPAIVKGFESIFNALRDGVLTLREAGKDLGFKGLENTLTAVGTALSTAIQFAIGFSTTLLEVISGIVTGVRSIADFFGLTVKQVGKVAAVLGSVIAGVVVWDNTMGKIGINFSNIFSIAKAIIPQLAEMGNLVNLFLVPALKTSLAIMAQIGAVVAVVIVGFDQLLGSIFDVNLSLSETISLLAKGFVAQVKESVQGWKALAIIIKDAATGVAPEETAAKLKAIKDEMQADTVAFNKEVADIIGKATERETRGPGFDPTFALKKGLKDATKAGTDFKGIISSADAEIAALAGTIFELENEIFKVGNEFRQAFNSKDLQGVGKQIQSIFSESLVASAEKLKKLRAGDVKVEDSIKKLIEEQGISAKRRAEIEAAASTDIKDRKKALADLNLTAPEAQLISLLRDQKDIREAISEFEEKSLQLAFKKAAIIAVETSRDMNREAVLLNANLAAERAITQVVANRLGARRQAVVEAENALNIAKVENKQAEESLQAQLAFAKEKFAQRTGPNAPTAAEQASFDALIASLEQRLAIEQATSAEKENQLEITRQEAALVESGSLTQGLERGFEQIANDLPSAFEAGVTIVRSSVQALTDFISSSIVSAFDPTDDSSLQERFARFLQGIAQIILQQIIQLAIASALQKSLADTESAATEVVAATTAAGIKTTAAIEAANIEIAAATTSAAILAGAGFGFHTGGIVKGYNSGGPVGRSRKAASAAHAFASGLASGGFPRPSGLHPADTVPAWLQPGEFVMRKAAVDSLGVDFFRAVNTGNFAAPEAMPVSGAHAAAPGMAKGGLVSDQLQRASLATSQGRDGGLTVVPVQVAGEKELDRMIAGGKSSFRQSLQDHASIIRSIAKGK